MAYVKEIATGVGVVACAIGIGVFVQYGGDQSQPQAKTPAATPAVAEEASVVEATLIEVDGIPLTSASNTAAWPGEDITLEDDPRPDVIFATLPFDFADPTEIPLLPEIACEIAMDATLDLFAQVSLDLSAPCLPNERVTLHHAGLKITETTGPSGNLSLTLPVLSENAVIIAAFTNGEGAVAQVAAPELKAVERIALHWQGAAGFEIHAREFGAAYGSDGHVWHGAADRDLGTPGTGGFLTRLGDASAPDAFMVDIYSFPLAESVQTGQVDLSVEAEVTASNCHSEINAQVLRLHQGTIESRDVILSTPTCDTVGSFLILNDLIQDLKIAAN